MADPERKLENLRDRVVKQSEKKGLIIHSKKTESIVGQYEEKRTGYGLQHQRQACTQVEISGTCFNREWKL